MYVCLCLGVTDGQIREAIYEGCCSYREVRNTLEVGTQCGKCACLAKQVVKETLAEVQSSQAALAYPATYAVA
jgi:bacterioferritin-associated ferredoxin